LPRANKIFNFASVRVTKKKRFLSLNTDDNSIKLFWGETNASA
jgi:hypothetical protein